MTVEKQFVLDMYTAGIDMAVKKMTDAVWPELNITKEVSFFSFGFHIYDIKCTKATYDKKGASLTVMNNKADVAQTGVGVTLDYSFKWRFQLFKMDVLYGAATGQAKSNKAVYTQLFVNRDIKSSANITWDFTYVLDWQSMFGVSKMLDYLFGSAAGYMGDVLCKPLSGIMLEGLRQWMDVKIPFHEDQSLIVWMMNSFYAVTESPQGYVTLGFATNLTGVDRPYNKRIFREVKTPVTISKKKCQVCMTNTMTAGIMEIQSKGKDFLFPIDPVKDLGLTGTLADLAEYMPRLAEKFDLSDPLYIGCRPTNGYSIERIKDLAVENGNTVIKAAVSCDFGDRVRGIPLVSANIVMRATLKMNYEESPQGYKITGNMISPKVYNYMFVNAYVPIYFPDSFASLLIQIVRLADNFPLLQSGLSVPPPFKATAFEKVLSQEEVCFSYS
jgi:hypothetical protein